MPFASIGTAIGLTAGQAALGAVGIGGALLSANASSDAADTAANASNRASEASIGEQRRQFDINQANQQPFLTGGTNAFNRLSTDLQPGGRFYDPISMANFQDSPFYQNSLKRTMDLLSRNQAAKGRYLSGGALDEQARTAAQAVGEQGQTYFNNEMANRNMLLGAQQSLAGVGPSTANYLGNAGANMASNVGNVMMSNAGNVGNAALSAAGQQNSAYGGAANMFGRMYGNRLRPGTTPSGQPDGGGGASDPYDQFYYS